MFVGPRVELFGAADDGAYPTPCRGELDETQGWIPRAVVALPQPIPMASAALGRKHPGGNAERAGGVNGCVAGRYHEIQSRDLRCERIHVLEGINVGIGQDVDTQSFAHASKLCPTISVLKVDEGASFSLQNRS